MEDSTLKKVAVMVGLAGLSILALTTLFQPEEYDGFSGTNPLQSNKRQISGTVIAKSVDPAGSTLTIMAEVEIDVRIFDEVPHDVGDDVLVVGTLSEFGDEVNIIADKVVLIP